MSEITVYTTSQVAAKAYVDSSTVRLWVKNGKLKPFRTTPGGHYRFNSDDVDALLSPTEAGAVA
jgi:excisionase family DNA binding protein